VGNHLFAVLDVSFAVNSCLNRIFYIYICTYHLRLWNTDKTVVLLLKFGTYIQSNSQCTGTGKLCAICVQCWLDHEKPIAKQVLANEPHFRFLLKFYTPDPVLLEDEFTRFALYAELLVTKCVKHTCTFFQEKCFSLVNYNNNSNDNNEYRTVPKQPPTFWPSQAT